MKSTVAIIGLGNIGKALATNLVKGNHPIIIASRKFEDAKQVASSAGDLAQAMDVAEAIKAADIIIPSVWFDVEKEFIQQYSKELKGKIIIDVSNPIAPDGNGGFKKIIEPNESAGKILAALIGDNAKLVKTFGTLGAESLAKAAHQRPEAAVMFYATNHTEINSIVEELIKDSGFAVLNVGGIDQSIRIEVFGDLHEFGALGKIVTLTEAKGKV